VDVLFQNEVNRMLDEIRKMDVDYGEEVDNNLLQTLMALQYGFDVDPKRRKVQMPFWKLPVDIGNFLGREHDQNDRDNATTGENRIRFACEKMLVEIADKIVAAYQTHGCNLRLEDYIAPGYDRQSVLAGDRVAMMGTILHSIAWPVIFWDDRNSWQHQYSLMKPDNFIPRHFDGWWYKLTSGADRAKFRRLLVKHLAASGGVVSDHYNLELHQQRHSGAEDLLERHGNMATADFFVTTEDDYFGVKLFAFRKSWEETRSIAGVKAVWVYEQSCVRDMTWDENVRRGGLYVK
jgi:hypothetical protein